jgi:integrase
MAADDRTAAHFPGRGRGGARRHLDPDGQKPRPGIWHPLAEARPFSDADRSRFEPVDRGFPMPLRAYPPGTRKGNRTYIFRGTVNGREREIATEFGADTPPETLRLAVAGAESRIIADERHSRIPRPGEDVSFARAARLYAAYRGLDLFGRHPDAIRINNLVREIGGMLVTDIIHADFIAVANRLCADRSPATKNREVLRMGAAVMHHAAENGLCPWLRVKLFREPRPQPRSVAEPVAAQLVNAVPFGSLERLFLLWIFHQGTRITDTLRIDWQRDIDLSRQTVKMRIGKSDLWVDRPLDPEVFEALAAVPERDRKGRVFARWGHRSNVYRWLRPLVRALGVTFTPHMARHTLGTELNNLGAGPRTIQDALVHADAKSSARYQSPDIEVIRSALGRTPRLVKRGK